MKYTLIFLILIPTLAVIVPAQMVFAVSVSNTVSASANTGENKNLTQTTKAGLGRASVSIKTMVDGVVVENIERFEEGTAVKILETSPHTPRKNTAVITKVETSARAGENIVGRESVETNEAAFIKVSDVQITRDMKEATKTSSTSAPHPSAVLKADADSEVSVHSDVDSVSTHSAFAGIGILLQSFMDTIKYVFTKFF